MPEPKKKKEPWELTDEEASEEAALLREELREADRAAAPLFAHMHRLLDFLDATDEELTAALSPEDAECVRRYREGLNTLYADAATRATEA